MTKTLYFCDICGKQITQGDILGNISISDTSGVLAMEACAVCRIKVTGYIAELRRPSKTDLL